MFGLIATWATTSFTVGSWSPSLQQTEAKGLAHLLDELTVRRHTGPRVDAELDHAIIQ